MVCGSDVNKRPICGSISQASKSSGLQRQLWSLPMSCSYVLDKYLIEISSWALGELWLVQCCHDVTFLIYYLKSFAKNNCGSLSRCHLMEILKGCWSNFIFNEGTESNWNTGILWIRLLLYPPHYNLLSNFQISFPSKCFCFFLFLNGDNCAPMFLFSSWSCSDEDLGQLEVILVVTA